ncbi:tudor domain-containing protein 5-like [Harmonia axyridis]|uniref:tudor domain-containing protein 5-like n=1 Tax=Harmonia axyridis TaxID=115357 RepID=UPI001E2798AF|nr:tudor domain-containing protein 5-like [Harmonia axyridis]
MSYSDKSTNALKRSTNQKTSLKCNKKTNRVGNRPTNYKSSSDNSREIRQRLNSGNKEIEGFSKNNCNKNLKNPKIVAETTKPLRRINYRDTSLNKDNSFNVDISLKGEKIYWNGGNIKKTYKKNNTVENCSGRENSLEKNIKSNRYTRSRYFTPTSSSHLMDSAVKNKSKETHIEKYESLSLTTKKNCIPKAVQDNLKNLIADFPEGICCSELPLVYKNFTGKDLLFEDFGYRCLIYLCLDLENIFYCNKESHCDYRLFDVRKPLPELNIPQEKSLEDMIQSLESSPAIPEMRWGYFESFVPHDAVRLGFKPHRIQVAEVLEEGTSINVTVADIYDISKFWIIIDDSQLDKLMDNMQEFYGINRTRYLVPKSLLVETLYCVVLFKGKFHRAVILNVMPGYEYLKVYYVDFGTLAKVSKTEVWFITKEFSELPTQAIRSTLGDIYPPNQGTTWSPSANYDFSSLTCMKKFIAEIIRVDKQKNLVDIKLNDGYSDMSDILVNRNLAKFINKPQKKHFDDPNCKPRVQYVHLFPTFDEIENWVVPCVEETVEFLNTPVTADFLNSQYFSRTVDTNLIKSIDKMEMTCKKNKSLMKYHKSSEISLNHNIEQINKIAYGDSYNFFTENKTYNVIENNHINESETEELEEIQDDVLRGKEIEESGCKGTPEKQNISFTNKRIFDIEDPDLLVSILRQSRMKKSYPIQTEVSRRF